MVNVSQETRSLIFTTGWFLMGVKSVQVGRKVKTVMATDIMRHIGVNHNEPKLPASRHRACYGYLSEKTCRRWWNRRNEFTKTGEFKQRKRSGRPRHGRFANETAIQETIQEILKIKVGEHLDDVLTRLGIKSGTTVRKYLKNVILWVSPQKQHAYDNDEVKKKRLEYAKFACTASWKPTHQIRDATFIDHKAVGWFGSNRQHNKIPKLRGQRLPTTKDTVKYLLKNPHLMTYFAVNTSGVSSFIHAFKRPKKRGGGNTVDLWNVDEDDCLEAWKDNFKLFCEQSDSDYVIADGCKMQHSKKMKDWFDSNHLRLHPSACRPENIKNGYPPYSHCFMPLDHKIFGCYQSMISKQTRELEKEGTFDIWHDSRLAQLHDIITETFENSYIESIAVDAIRDYGLVCKKVYDLEGDIRGI